MPKPNPFEWVFTCQGDETLNELLKGTEDGTLVWHATRSKESKRALCRRTIQPSWRWATNFPGYAGPAHKCISCQKIVERETHEVHSHG